MSYAAVDVARYMVTYCIHKSTPISNLKLQKMLYYAWVDYYNQTGQHLFSDSICAWQFGPVVPEVYYEFCVYGGSPIYQEFPILLRDDDEPILNNIIEQYRTVSANELVERSHKPGGPWDLTFGNGKGLRSVIPFQLIERLECERI